MPDELSLSDKLPVGSSFMLRLYGMEGSASIAVFKNKPFIICVTREVLIWFLSYGYGTSLASEGYIFVFSFIDLCYQRINEFCDAQANVPNTLKVFISNC